MVAAVIQVHDDARIVQHMLIDVGEVGGVIQDSSGKIRHFDAPD